MARIMATMDESNGSVIDRHENFVNKGRGGGIFRESLFSEVAKTVCRIHNDQYGTGFLGRVPLNGKDCVVLITNSHVISNMETALASNFTFQFVKDNEGVAVKGSDLFSGCENSHRIHPTKLPDRSLGLDYFICQVNVNCLTSLRDGLTDHTLDIVPCQLTDTVEVSLGDVVYVIQHPKGQPRSISSYTINHVFGSLLFYQCDTDLGSSGSPVFKEVNGELKVVALHRGGRDPKQGSSGYNIGSLVSSILDHLSTGHYNDCMPKNSDLEKMEQQVRNINIGAPASDGVDTKGPERPAKSTKSSFKSKEQFAGQLLLFLQDIEGRWIEFATELEISGSVIDNINADCCRGMDSAKSCWQMFDHWLKSTRRDKRNWSTITQAAITLQINDLVKVIEEKDVDGDKEPKMGDLQRFVCPRLEDSWYDYGLQIGIKMDKLDSIKNDNSGGGNKECMRRVISHWLKSSTDCSWERVISALEAIGEINLSERVSDKYVTTS